MIEKFVVKNWMILTVGFLLTALFVRMAYNERGFIAFGSEWLAIPFLFVARKLIQDIGKEMEEWL